MKNIYFISDAHLGCLALPHPRQHERRLVHFLDGIKHKASAVYMLGDMFDFWFEYRTVVPSGTVSFPATMIRHASTCSSVQPAWDSHPSVTL